MKGNIEKLVIQRLELDLHLILPKRKIPSSVSASL